MPNKQLQPVEQAIIAWLKALLPAEYRSVSTKVPNPRPRAFTVVQRSGGAPRNLVQSNPSLLVQVWGTGTVESEVVSPWPLTKLVWEAMANSDETGIPGIQVMESSLTLPVNYPDEATGSPRYTFIFTPTINTNT